MLRYNVWLNPEKYSEVVKLLVESPHPSTAARDFVGFVKERCLHINLLEFPIYVFVQEEIGKRSEWRVEEITILRNGFLTKILDARQVKESKE